MAVVVAVLAVFLGPLAAPAGAETRLDVSAGYAGFHAPGRALPVQVTVTAERLVKGELAVLGSGKVAATLPVEVAGGSVKRFTMVVPGGVTSSARPVEVELRVGGRVLGRGRADVRSDDDTELVGLGPRLVEGRPVPGPAPLAVDAGVARFAALDTGLLAQAPASLEPLSAVGLASGELAALAPSVRAGLLRWVGAGGQLLLDEPAGAGGTIEGLPADWQPGPSGRTVAGVGEVRLTGDALSAGRLTGLIEPSSVGQDFLNGFGSAESVADSLAGDAGLRLPGLPWLLGFLGLYIAVVGPVTGFVLRRRRRPDLAWVVVPGLAVLFTVGAYVAGNQLRPGAGLAHGSVVETGPSGPVATSWVALTRRTAGTARVDLPAGWAVEGTATENLRCLGCPGFDLKTPSVGVGDEGPQARLPLASGEFGAFKASGPVALTGRLEVTALSGGDGAAHGTVRNGLPFAVDRIVVFVGQARARVGRLNPGEQRQWSVGPGDRMIDPSGSEAWLTGFQGFSRFEPDDLVNLSLWQSAQGDLGEDGDPSGTALAVGWTREWEPTIKVDGNERRARGRTAVVGRAPVTVTGRRVTDMAVDIDVVRGPGINPFRGKFGGPVNHGGASVVKLTLPAEAPAPAGGAAGKAARRSLVVRTSLALTGVAVWHNGAWQQLDVPWLGNDLDAVLRFKRGIAIDDGVFLQPPMPPGAVPTTTMPMAPGLGQVPATTGPPPLPEAIPLPPRPVPFPGGGGVVAAGNGTVDVPLPDGVGAGGVVFLRLVVDQTNLSGDATLSLVEVAG